MAQAIDDVLTRVADDGKRFNAVITVTDDRARALAAVSSPQPRPLEGTPLAVKDIIDVEGYRTTVGSHVSVGREPAPSSAPVVTALEDLGAITVAKSNCQEFSYSIVGDESAFGQSTNPRGRDLITGGSSNGSAVLVASGAVPLAVGTDTAGSVRVPAACCGVVGFKPTHGTLPATGVFPLAPSCDTVGLLGADLGIVRRAMAGLVAAGTADTREIADATLAGEAAATTAGNVPPTSAPGAIGSDRDADMWRPLAGPSLPEEQPRATIVELAVLAGSPDHAREYALLEAMMSSGTQEGVSAETPENPAHGSGGEAAEDATASPGALPIVTAGQRERWLALFDQAAEFYEPIRRFESYAVTRHLLTDQRDRFLPTVGARLAGGADVGRARYERGLTAMARLREHAEDLMGDADVLVTPVFEGHVPTWFEADKVPDISSRLIRYTVPFNILGWPALTLPLPAADDRGAPLAVQLVARPGCDLRLLDLASRVAS